MIVFTRFPLEHLVRLSPEYIYTDLPREFPGYVFSRRPPYIRSRSRDPLEQAARLAEYLGEELVRSSRDVSSGTLYAEGLRIEYSYSGGILRRVRVRYAPETEPFAIERGEKIFRPVSLLLLEREAVILEFARSDGIRRTRGLGMPLPGTLYAKGDFLRARLLDSL